MNKQASSGKPNGAAAAAVVAAGIGALALGLCTFLADKSVATKAAMVFYKPSGALSGISTLSVAAWLIMWLGLHFLWSRKELSLRKVTTISLLLLSVSLLLTFPPLIDAL